MTEKKKVAEVPIDPMRAQDDREREREENRLEKRPDAKRPASAGFCVYLGPSIRGVIQSGTVFAGDASAAMASLVPAAAGYPLIASLIVDGATLPEDRLKVKTPGNLLFVYHKRLASGRG